MVKTIKISTPWGHSFLKDQIHPSIHDFKFEIDNDVQDCDYWIVWGGLPKNANKQSAICSRDNVFFMTDEVHDQKNYAPDFLAQFAKILTVREDIIHKNIVKIHEYNHWHLHKTIEELLSLDYVKKDKNISVVCSDLTDLPGHKLRYALVNRLIGHFKDRLDVYGRGFNPVVNKWDALAPYKYSIAIENNAVNGYFTEKITECYLAHTIPIYYGAPDIDKYFNPNSYITIDINNYKKTIETIERILEEDLYIDKLEIIKEEKNKYLSKYHLFSALRNFITEISPSVLKEERVVVFEQSRFDDYYHIKKILALGKKTLRRWK
ncbi:glycosyltransferase family 10 domain-containing protein [Pedobacter xixiisoli]|uniref:Glycosyltransferase family 10 (Fucosyltransferase) C-term n=1 Tax=Pedobacter xixiisoli TaxID=1476464 RepID=A0A286A9R7_9SPHI|nr:glycosyltransferase family 10 [Pedobacter xixiisoli]SOD18629.1 Glycosyltransferase family 10 (fucosyltransferase) C-term [Pedobacter xixiisoli]